MESNILFNVFLQVQNFNVGFDITIGERVVRKNAAQNGGTRMY